MREIIQKLNKASLAEATGISYGRLRKYSAGIIEKLTPDERDKIYQYLIALAQKIKE